MSFVFSYFIFHLLIGLMLSLVYTRSCRKVCDSVSVLFVSIPISTFSFICMLMNVQHLYIGVQLYGIASQAMYRVTVIGMQADTAYIYVILDNFTSNDHLQCIYYDVLYRRTIPWQQSALMSYAAPSIFSCISYTMENPRNGTEYPPPFFFVEKPILSIMQHISAVLLFIIYAEFLHDSAICVTRVYIKKLNIDSKYTGFHLQQYRNVNFINLQK